MVAAAVLIAFGIAAIFMGFNGRSTVTRQPEAGEDRRLARRDAIGDQGRGRRRAGLPSNLSFPTMAVAGKKIDTGAGTRAFAELHAHPRAGRRQVA